MLHFNPAVAAGVIVEDAQGRVLLIRRAKEPARGSYGVPGGFVDIGESVEDAVRREAREETGLEVERLRFLGGWPNLYSWRGVDYPVLDLYFTARVRPGSLARPLDEVEACVWRAPEDIAPASLAFDSTRSALASYREQRASGGA